MSPSDTAAVETVDGPVAGTSQPTTTTSLNLPAQFTKPTEFNFTFKKQTDALGEKRAPVKLEVPIPTFDGLVQFLQVEGAAGDKNRALIMELIEGVIKEHTRLQVADSEKPVNKQTELDVSKLDLQFIANLPASERRGTSIAAEVWEEFGKDYMAVMPAATGRPADKVANAVAVFLKKMMPAKNNKDALGKLKTLLDQYFMTTTEEKAEEFQEIYEFLTKRIEAYMTSTDEALLSDL